MFHVGSWFGIDALAQQNSTFSFPFTLKANKEYALTILVDNTGLDGNWVVGLDLMKAPRGILDYAIIHSSSSTDRAANGTTTTKVERWKITGNFGGENYIDKTRGPLHEGGMWFERHGLHLSGASTNGREASTLGQKWTSRHGGPIGDNFDTPGVRFYTTSFNLAVDEEWDIPFSFVFDNITCASTGSTGKNTHSSSESNKDNVSSPIAYRAFLYVNG